MKQHLPLYWLCTAMIFLWSCSNAKKLTQTDLYFGMSQNNGAQISDSAWNIFVQQHISRVFIDGFTVINAEGQWQDHLTRKIYTEPSRIVIHISPMNSLLSARVDSLREKYKTLFYQKSVLRINKKVTAGF